MGKWNRANSNHSPRSDRIYNRPRRTGRAVGGCKFDTQGNNK